MDKLKEAMSAISSKSVHACAGFQQVLFVVRKHAEEQVDVMEVFNQIASLSDWDYALAIRDTIFKISYCRVSPNYETIMSLSKLAIEALKSGVSPSDVLEYFDTILYMERNGGTP